MSVHIYSYGELVQAERRSYGDNKIEMAHYEMFKTFAEIEVPDVQKRWEIATEIVSRQSEFWMEKLVAY